LANVKDTLKYFSTAEANKNCISEITEADKMQFELKNNVL